MKELLRLGRVGYEESLRHYGVSTSGPHAWDNQSEECKSSWAAVARAIMAAARDGDKQLENP